MCERLKNNDKIMQLFDDKSLQLSKLFSYEAKKTKHDYLHRYDISFCMWLNNENTKRFNGRYFYDGDNEGVGKIDIWLGYFDDECDEEINITIDSSDYTQHTVDTLIDKLNKEEIESLNNILKTLKLSTHEMFKILYVIFEEIGCEYKIYCQFSHDIINNT